MKEEQLLKMKLHELSQGHTFKILRVPGGWIYYEPDTSLSVFVPYDTNSHNDLIDLINK